MKIDTDLRRDVLDELEWEPSIDAAEIGVASHNGIVTLTGDVKSYAEKLTAERVTKRIQGVKAIANDINVRLPGTAERTDSDIAGVAVDALELDHVRSPRGGSRLLSARAGSPSMARSTGGSRRTQPSTRYTTSSA